MLCDIDTFKNRHLTFDKHAYLRHSVIVVKVVLTLMKKKHLMPCFILLLLVVNTFSFYLRRYRPRRAALCSWRWGLSPWRSHRLLRCVVTFWRCRFIGLTCLWRSLQFCLLLYELQFIISCTSIERADILQLLLGKN